MFDAGELQRWANSIKPLRRLFFFAASFLALDGWRFAPLIWRRMSCGDSQTAICPGCGEEIESAKKRCPHCGRPMGERGFFFYAFWVGLTLIVAGLIACIFYTGFLMLNRML